MLRRWGILLGMLTLLAGLAVATTGSASAGTMGFRPGGPVHLVGSAAAVPNARGGIRHQAESTNWSGYAATTGTYTSVSASWTEPTGTCSGSAKYSSFWVGLDGYNSSSVEQTGSEVDCSGSSARYYAWYEMYPNPPVNLSMTITPGNTISAEVSASGDSFTLSITNVATGSSFTTTQTSHPSFLARSRTSPKRSSSTQVGTSLRATSPARGKRAKAPSEGRPAASQSDLPAS